jgi:hypothetical protein
MRGGELAHCKLPARERLEDAAPRAVGQRGEDRIQSVVCILNHVV